jgi:hypothetical protein
LSINCFTKNQRNARKIWFENAIIFLNLITPPTMRSHFYFKRLNTKATMKYSIRMFMVFLQLVFAYIFCEAQTNLWTWVNGMGNIKPIGNYGIKGVPDTANKPPLFTSEATYWSDNKGNIWMFGGTNYINYNTNSYLRNDLWKWDGIQWTWLSGSKDGNVPGKYGVYRKADTSNCPGSRYSSSGWIDKDGNLWLYGGYGYDDTGLGHLADLWKWDGHNWTWMSGKSNSTTYTKNPNYGSNYGIKNVPDTANFPVKSTDLTVWSDKEGNGWLFGGNYLQDDLWKWDGNNWTWVAGSKQQVPIPIYGIQGIADTANTPGGRLSCSVKQDGLGNTWLFGGYFINTAVMLNDLWQWDGHNWTYINGKKIDVTTTYNQYDYGKFGSKGEASTTNQPSSRIRATCWIDNLNIFWLFGGNGVGQDSLAQPALLNDLWKWDGNNWTWMGGGTMISAPDKKGTKGILDTANWPSASLLGFGWNDNNGNDWIFIGDNVYQNIWKWKDTQWAWMYENLIPSAPASIKPVYGLKGIPSSTNTPGSRSGGVSWSDKNGNLWLFEGGIYNDIWKWDGSNWTWIYGSNTNNPETKYGVVFVTDSNNIRHARVGSTGVTDSKGNLWIYGGLESYGYWYNDLWKWDGNLWTWYGGGINYLGMINLNPVELITDPGTRPNGKIYGMSWIDSKDNIWLFGGMSSIYRGYYHYSNDLWKWNGQTLNWSSIKVPEANSSLTGSYGTKSVALPTNIPSQRCCSVTWTDSKDNLWLFGGYALLSTNYPNLNGPGGSVLNDLWKWDGQNWTWIAGDNIENQIGIYGKNGIADSSNKPGARAFGMGWIDEKDNLWLFGGKGFSGYNDYDGATSYGITDLNDLWKFDGKNWTWMMGAPYTNSFGYLGFQGFGSYLNMPNAKNNASRWKDKLGNFWLYSGDYSNDLWKFNYGTPLVTAINTPSTSINTGQIILLNNPTRNNQLSLVLDKYYIKLNWEIFDLNGRPIQEGVFRMVSKGSRISATTKSLTSGTYMVKLTGDDKSVQTKKWIRF